jgi:TRAP-type mannitol/chloroaromatic compound transport system substrate-binding protein
MAESVVHELAQADGATQKIHASYMKFRTRALAWAQSADQAYLAQRAEYR